MTDVPPVAGDPRPPPAESVPSRPASTAPGDPASMNGGLPRGPGRTPGPEPRPSPGPWYRRRAFLVAAGVVVVIGASVLSDLPTSTSRASDIQAETTVDGEITSDIAPCVFAVRESLGLYADETSGNLSAGNRAQIPGLLSDDQNACSFTDNNIFELSDLDVPGTAAGKDMAQAVNAVTIWATSDALSVIEDIQTLTAHPRAAGARAKLQSAERLLAQDRAAVTADVDDADRELRTSLPTIGLSTATSATAGPSSPG